MTLIATREIGKRTKIGVDPNKIVKHESEITGIGLYLSEDRSGLDANIQLVGFSKNGHRFKRWQIGFPEEEKVYKEQQEQAQKEYHDLVAKFKRGEYKIDVYDNGKVEVTLLD